MNLILVALDVASSNRTAYPTSVPRGAPLTGVRTFEQKRGIKTNQNKKATTYKKNGVGLKTTKWRKKRKPSPFRPKHMHHSKISPK